MAAGSIQNGALVLNGDQAHQIHDVLRLKPGEILVALDGTGAEYQVELTIVGSKTIRGRVLERDDTKGEPRTELVLYQSLLKADKFEWILQKGTEIGIAEFVPVITQRSVVESVSRAKRARWERIISEAAEQSGRGKIPLLDPVQEYKDVVQDAEKRRGIALIPWEEERVGDLTSVLAGASAGSPISLFIGPEGGFDAVEIDFAVSRGIHPVTLGPRILRAETASLVAATMIFFTRGDLGFKSKEERAQGTVDLRAIG